MDAIAEAAGTNKMTLYRHFGSKDDLIVECMRKAASDVEATWSALEAKYRDDRMGMLHAWIQVGAECVSADGRGCDLANAAVELAEGDHPAKRFIEDVKKAHRDRLAALCRGAGIADSDLLADTLSLLFDGARVSRQSAGPEGPSARFVRISEAIVACFMARLPTKSSRDKPVGRQDKNAVRGGECRDRTAIGISMAVGHRRTDPPPRDQDVFGGTARKGN